MVATSFREQNYSRFEDLLSADETSYTIEQLGWEALSDEAKYLEAINKRFTVIDSTDLRLRPEHVCVELTQKLGIAFNRAMIDGWQEGDFSHFITQQSALDKKDQFVWYDTLSGSTGIKLPTEKPPLLRAFPKSVREYVKGIAIPIYIDLYTSESKVQIEGSFPRDLNHKDIDPVHAFLSENTTLSNQELLSKILTLAEGYPETDFMGRKK